MQLRAVTEVLNRRRTGLKLLIRFELAQLRCHVWLSSGSRGADVSRLWLVRREDGAWLWLTVLLDRFLVRSGSQIESE